MKKAEILYDWPISHLKWLCDSTEAEQFATNLTDDSALNTFVALTEQIRSLAQEIEETKAAKALFKRWTDLRVCVDEFEKHFSSFPNLKPKKLKVSLLLAAKTTTSLPTNPAPGPDLDDTDVNESAFDVRELNDSLPLAWFVRQNATSFLDSIVVFSCADFTRFETEFASSTISPELLFQLLALIHASPDVPTGHAALVKKSTPMIDAPAVDAFAKLVILASGRPIHSPRGYTSVPSVVDHDAFKAGIPYQQLNDVFNVLSEYNSRDDILTKFITVYHVIENFMYKLPIVELERQQGGRMFSLRDFRRLFKQIDQNEEPALRRLFSAIFQLPATPATGATPAVTFAQRIVRRWNGLVPATPEAEIDKALGAMELKRDKRSMLHAEFGTGDVPGNFAQMVYAIRNAIVHNKETEFHLTYATLDNTISTLIESFVLPSLEEICFALVGSPNKHVWYQNKELLLYK